MVVAGGGYYGGYAYDSAYNSSGGGGSGYLGDVIDGNMLSGVREGNGCAIIKATVKLIIY